MFGRSTTCWLVGAVVGVFALPALGLAGTTQFDFGGDLSATVGAGTLSFAGDTGDVIGWGTASSFGLPALSGGDAEVMHFPAFTAAQGLLLDTASPANGGGALINQYTMIFDLLVPDVANLPEGYMSFFNADPNNSNDGDFFLKGSTRGIGIGGQYDGTISDNTWYRVAIVVDGTTDPTIYPYIDGTALPSHDEFVEIDGRWSLQPGGTAGTWLLADESGTPPDPAETGEGYISCYYFTDRMMGAGEIAALGGPTAGGVVPEPSTFVLLLACGLAGLLTYVWRKRK